jgi:hypothetical protein
MEHQKVFFPSDHLLVQGNKRGRPRRQHHHSERDPSAFYKYRIRSERQPRSGNREEDQGQVSELHQRQADERRKEHDRSQLDGPGQVRKHCRPKEVPSGVLCCSKGKSLSSLLL